MPVRIWLPWKHQVPSTITCHTKLCPHEFYFYFYFYLNTENAKSDLSQRGHFPTQRPPPPLYAPYPSHPVGLNRVKVHQKSGNSRNNKACFAKASV